MTVIVGDCVEGMRQLEPCSRIVAEREQAERARAELEAAGQLTLEGTA